MWRSDERRDSDHLGQRERDGGGGKKINKKKNKKNKGRKMLLLLLLLRDVRYSIQGFCQYSCAVGDEGPAAPILHTNTHK